jgi:hypothetical protein
MLAFVISLDDVIITEFVKSAGQDTLATYMLGQFRRTLTPEVNAISTALLALTLVILTAFFLSRESGAEPANTQGDHPCDFSSRPPSSPWRPARAPRSCSSTTGATTPRPS